MPVIAEFSLAIAFSPSFKAVRSALRSLEMDSNVV